MPTVVVSNELAVQRLTELIEAGEKLLSSDPAKSVDGKFLPTEEMAVNILTLRKHTADWIRTVIAVLNLYIPIHL
jgi:hypothetical protein